MTPSSFSITPSNYLSYDTLHHQNFQRGVGTVFQAPITSTHRSHYPGCQRHFNHRSHHYGCWKPFQSTDQTTHIIQRTLNPNIPSAPKRSRTLIPDTSSHLVELLESAALPLEVLVSGILRSRQRAKHRTHVALGGRLTSEKLTSPFRVAVRNKRMYVRCTCRTLGGGTKMGSGIDRRFNTK